MDGYLGTVLIDKSTHPDFKDLTPKDYALLFILKYGGIDGEDHKDWVLDQVAQILNGVEVIVSEALWVGGKTEIRIETSEAWTDEYEQFVASCRGEWDAETDEYEYDYKFGVAP